MHMSCIHWSEQGDASISIFSAQWENEYKGEETFWQLVQKENIQDLNRKHCRNGDGEANLWKPEPVLPRAAQEGAGMVLGN